MFLRDLEDVRRHFASVGGSVVGVGMKAYPRSPSSFFASPYRIVAARKTADLDILRKNVPVFCLEEETGFPITEDKFNSFHLLRHAAVRSFLEDLPKPVFLLLYQSYPELDILSKREGWVLLGNQGSLRMSLARRTFFHKMASDLGLATIPGGFYPLDQFLNSSFDTWKRHIGEKLVVQLADLYQGGGKGTFFAFSPGGYRKIAEKLKDREWRGQVLNEVSIRPFIEGIPASLAICLTRHGAIFSSLQRQLIDLPYCRGLAENGIFCGHSWGSSPWPRHVESEAHKQAKAITKYLWNHGYKGVMGIDFIIEPQGWKVYPLEINPRFTGAFPMLSLLYMEKGLIPFEAFHVMEFFDSPYQIDLNMLNHQYAQPLRGSQLLVFLQSAQNRFVTNGLKAGLYEKTEEDGEYFHVKKTLSHQEIENDQQFVIADGPPEVLATGQPLHDPLHRLCRLIFSYPVVDDRGALLPEALKAAGWVQRKLVRTPF
jgi:hypothetical protein